MKFRTEIENFIANFDINLHSKNLFIGSCFSNNIGDILYKNKFQTLINPYGVLYNPKSIYNSLEFIIKNKKFKQSDLFYYNNNWISFNHHGSFSGNNADKVLENINLKNNLANKFLKISDFIFITFGTSYTYKLIETNKIVANCHKINPNKFERELLSVENIFSDYKKIINKLKYFNPKLKIIFTVSPIRHLKDGLHQNQISKSTLILAINKINKEFSNTYYFPSYEIINDDLRDYRFYKNDLTHISNFAINYIWEKFTQFYFKNSTIAYLEKINKIIKAVNHKPFNKTSAEHQKFIKKTLYKINKLEKDFNINFSDEKEILQKNINKIL